MTKEKLFELYQKLYFHEFELREKLSTRIQINLAILLTISSALIYMTRVLDLNQPLPVVAGFAVSIVFSLVCLVPAARYIKEAFWGNEYKGIPTANDTEQLRQEAENYENEINIYYEDYPDFSFMKPEFSSRRELKDYLYDHYAKCSSHNAEVNMFRNQCIHESTRWIINSSLPLFFACTFFIGFDLDASSPRKSLLIEDSGVNEPLHVVGKDMSAVNTQEVIIVEGTGDSKE